MYNSSTVVFQVKRSECVYKLGGFMSRYAIMPITTVCKFDMKHDVDEVY